MENTELNLKINPNLGDILENVDSNITELPTAILGVVGKKSESKSFLTKMLLSYFGESEAGAWLETFLKNSSSTLEFSKERCNTMCEIIQCIGNNKDIGGVYMWNQPFVKDGNVIWVLQVEMEPGSNCNPEFARGVQLLENFMMLVCSHLMEIGQAGTKPGVLQHLENGLPSDVTSVGTICENVTFVYHFKDKQPLISNATKNMVREYFKNKFGVPVPGILDTFQNVNVAWLKESPSSDNEIGEFNHTSNVQHIKNMASKVLVEIRKQCKTTPTQDLLKVSSMGKYLTLIAESCRDILTLPIANLSDKLNVELSDGSTVEVENGQVSQPEITLVSPDKQSKPSFTEPKPKPLNLAGINNEENPVPEPIPVALYQEKLSPKRLMEISNSFDVILNTTTDNDNPSFATTISEPVQTRTFNEQNQGPVEHYILSKVGDEPMEVDDDDFIIVGAKEVLQDNLNTVVTHTYTNQVKNDEDSRLNDRNALLGLRPSYSAVVSKNSQAPLPKASLPSLTPTTHSPLAPEHTNICRKSSPTNKSQLNPIDHSNENEQLLGPVYKASKPNQPFKNQPAQQHHSAAKVYVLNDKNKQSLKDKIANDYFDALDNHVKSLTMFKLKSRKFCEITSLMTIKAKFMQQHNATEEWKRFIQSQFQTQDALANNIEDIISDFGEKLQSRFDNFVCYANLRDIESYGHKERMKSFVAAQEINYNYGGIVEKACKSLTQEYIQDNDKILLNEQIMAGEVVSEIVAKYETSLKKYLGAQHRTGQEPLLTLQARMVAKCKKMLISILNFDGKTNQALNKSGKDLETKLDQVYYDTVLEHCSNIVTGESGHETSDSEIMQLVADKVEGESRDSMIMQIRQVVHNALQQNLRLPLVIHLTPKEFKAGVLNNQDATPLLNSKFERKTPTVVGHLNGKLLIGMDAIRYKKHLKNNPSEGQLYSLNKILTENVKNQNNSLRADMKYVFKTLLEDVLNMHSAVAEICQQFNSGVLIVAPCWLICILGNEMKAACNENDIKNVRFIQEGTAIISYIYKNHDDLGRNVQAKKNEIAVILSQNENNIHVDIYELQPTEKKALLLGQQWTKYEDGYWSKNKKTVFEDLVQNVEETIQRGRRIKINAHPRRFYMNCQNDKWLEAAMWVKSKHGNVVTTHTYGPNVVLYGAVFMTRNFAKYSSCIEDKCNKDTTQDASKPLNNASVPKSVTNTSYSHQSQPEASYQMVSYEKPEPQPTKSVARCNDEDAAELNEQKSELLQKCAKMKESVENGRSKVTEFLMEDILEDIETARQTAMDSSPSLVKIQAANVKLDEFITQWEIL